MGIIGEGGEESWHFLHQQGGLKCMFCLGEWGRPCDQRLEGNAWSINLRGHDLQKIAAHDVQHHIPLDVQFLIWEWRWWPSVCEAASSNGALSTTMITSFPSCTHSWRVSWDLSGGQGHTTGSLQRLLHQGAQVICKLGFVAIMLSF